MSTSTAITQDLTDLLKVMTGLQKKRAWRNALSRTARKVRKRAVTDLKATGFKKAAKIAKSIRASANRKLNGFSVKVTPSRKPTSYYINSQGKGVALAQFVHTGTKNRLHYGRSANARGRGCYSTGSTRRYTYLDNARKVAYPAAKAEIGAEVEAAAKKAIAKCIKEHYGLK